ncbi:MAG: hypothetical protein N4A50_08615 [Vallitalea sp.]|jgi:hypothetical protein|nr:hypothetical protein [Vallitalea sp.]
MDIMSLATIKKNINEKIDIHNTLEQLLIKQQHNYYKSAVYDMIFNYITFLEMINDNDVIDKLNKDTGSDNIITYIKSILKEYTNLSSCQREIDELMEFRNKIETQTSVLMAYLDEALLYEYIINRIEGKFIKDYVDIEEDESFAGNILNFMFEEEDSFIIGEKVKKILSHLPVRITNNKFYEYVEESLNLYKGAYVNDLNNFIELLKQTILPKEVEGYNSTFEYITDLIGTLENTDYKNINEKDFENVKSITVEIAETISTIISVYTLITSITNNLIELSLCDKLSMFIDEEDLVDANILLNSISKNVEDFVIDEQLAQQLENVEGIIEENINNVDKYNSIVQHVIDSHMKDLHSFNLTTSYENIQKIDYIYATSSLFVDYNKEKITDEEKRVDEFTLAKSKKELIQLIERGIQGKSRYYKRAVIGQLFSMLPVSFKKPEEIYDYIIHSLNQCSDKYEKDASKQLIREVINEFSLEI